MAYTIDIYPNPENAPDKPYFTKAIFSNSCQRGKENLDKIQDLLGDIITDFNKTFRNIRTYRMNYT